MTTIAPAVASCQDLPTVAYLPAGVCLSQDSDLITHAAHQYLPAGDDLLPLDFNDPQVFATYYDLFFRPLVRYACAVARLDHAHAEDVVQNAFVSQMQQPLPPLAWPQFQSWMYHRVRRAALHVWQVQRGSESLEALQDREPTGGTWEPTVPSAESCAMQHEELREVGQALAQLPPTAQAMIQMSLADWTPRQMAQHLVQQGIAGTAVTYPVEYLAQARRQMRQQVQRDRRHLRVLRRSGQRGPARGHLGGWWAGRPACRRCGTTERQHHQQGLCRRCHTWLQRHPDGVVTSGQQWGPGVDACVMCGTTERRHESKGRCKRCDRRSRQAWEGKGVCGRTDAPYESKGQCKRCTERERRQRERRARSSPQTAS